MRRRRPAGDRGQAALELVGMLPLILFIGLAALQLGAAMWTITSTNEAARQAARAYSLTDSVGAARSAAAGSLPGALRVADVSTAGSPHGIRLTVKIPTVIPISLGSVTRTVEMP